MEEKRSHDASTSLGSVSHSASSEMTMHRAASPTTQTRSYTCTTLPEQGSDELFGDGTGNSASTSNSVSHPESISTPVSNPESTSTAHQQYTSTPVTHQLSTSTPAPHPESISTSDPHPESTSNSAPQATSGARSLHTSAPVDSRKDDGKTYVSFKPLPYHPSIDCDVIICLWDKTSLNAGKHKLLEAIGIEIEDIDNFKSGLLIDMIKVTTSTKRRTLIHCKYDSVSVHQIANAVLRCVLYTETQKTHKILLPLVYNDDLLCEACIVTQAVMSSIKCIQKSNRNKQSLRKFYLGVDSQERVDTCKAWFRSLKEKRATKKCCTCEGQASGMLKTQHMQRGVTCACFCVQCLKDGRKEGLLCPEHGPCLTPVGHGNSMAVTVSGFEHTRIFHDDALRMARLFQSDYVGVSKENTRTVTLTRPGKNEDLKQRLKETFSDLRRVLRQNPARRHPSCLYFYFSGHNNDNGLVLGGADDTITPRELKKEFRKLHMDTIVILLDCCFSGGTGLTQLNSLLSDEFMVSLTSMSLEGLDSIMTLPKLWNLSESKDLAENLDEPQAGSSEHVHKTTVYQWSSCYAEERSIFSRESLFTDTIINLIKGKCPLKEHPCEACDDFRSSVFKSEAILLKDLHACVAHHVSLKAKVKDKEQHPQLDMSHDEDLMFAFHTFTKRN